MKKTCFLLVLGAIFCSSAPNPETVISPLPRSGKDLAVFFAVEKYQNGTLTNLQNPVKNARDLAAILKSRFGFETEVLENPTQKQIIDRLNDLSRLYARNEDGKHPSDGQLFLFFSGHGLSEDENGYFLPADVDPATPWEKGIAYEIWRPKINKINCRHILVAFDACYSVRFDPDWKNKTDGQFKRPGELTDSQRALANYETYKARVFFTSDNKENQTPDHSNFAKKLLEGLRSAAATDGFLTSNQLFANYVQGATPTPRAGTFGDDEPSSAFLFYDLNGPAKNIPPPVAITPQTTTGGNQGSLAAEIEKDMVWIEGGNYRFGKSQLQAKTNDVKVLDSSGSHYEKQTTPPDSSFVVELDGFYLSKFEVTQGLWRKVIGGDPTELKFKGCDKCPVENVSWEDAQVFIRTLNAKTGQKYRLPTEFEWEYAARCRNSESNGGCAEELDLKDLAWYKSNSGDRTHPVGEKQPNRLGLYDMAGNVKEWCANRMQDTYYRECRAARKVVNPQGPTEGKLRVRRGGSFDSKSWNTDPIAVGFDKSDTRDDDTGFRLARSQ